MREQHGTRADLLQPKDAPELRPLASPPEKPMPESAIWSEFMRRTLTEDLPGGLYADDDDLRDAVPAG